MRTAKRREIDPKLLKKASREVEATGTNPIGEREATPNGYRIKGVVCKDFETFYEFIDRGQQTAKMCHPKKTRTYRVVAGQGFAQVEQEDKKKSIVLVPGQEFVVEPGISVQLLTTSSQTMELFVCQASKYEANLKLDTATQTQTSMEESQLKAVSYDQAVDVLVDSMPRRRGSKAAQQQREASRLYSKQPMGAVDPVTEKALVREANFAVNLKPTLDLRGEEG